MGTLIGKQMESLKRQREQRGFTLIELLIVIVVIGILAGIAILAFNPFQQSAAEACATANNRIEAGADAAVEAAAIMEIAGLDTVDDFLDPRGGGLDCTVVAGGGGGGGGVTISAGATATSGATLTSNPSATISATATNTLIAYSAHRQGTSAGAATATMAGWTPVGTAERWDTTGNRRTIAVFTKQAAGGSENAQVVWTNQAVGEQTLVIREFVRSDGPGPVSVGGFTPIPGTEANSTSLDLGSASPGSGVTLAGLVTRDDATPVDWSGGVGSVLTGTPGNITVSSGITSTAGSVTADFGSSVGSTGFRVNLTP